MNEILKGIIETAPIWGTTLFIFMLPILLGKFLEEPAEKEMRKQKRYNRWTTKARFTKELVAELESRKYKTEVKDGKITINPNEKVYPASSVDDLYELFKTGLSIGSMADELLKLKRVSKSKCFEPLITNDLTYRLMNTTRHEETLQYLPTKKLFGDIAVCLVAHLKNTDGEDVLKTVTKTMYLPSMWMTASNYAPSIDPPLFAEYYDYAENDDPENVLITGWADEESRYILTSENGIFGASVMFYEGIVERIYEILGKFYAIPTSPDCWLIMSAINDSNEMRHNLTEYLRDNNLDSDDVLSDYVYIFDGDEFEKI